MSLLTNLLIGRSGMAAAQAGLNATSQNVANASVAGATRRVARTSVADPLRDGPTWLGQGASVDGMDRPSDRFLLGRRVQALGDARRSELAWEDLRSIERIYDASQGTTTKDTLEAFFDSMTRATSDPADLSLRRGVVRAAQDLASYISRDARTFAGTMSDEAKDLTATLPAVNEMLSGVARLNQAIASSDTGTLTAGDIKDQRDQLLADLGQLAGVQIDMDAKGVATVFIGGHAAVSGQEARQLSATTDPVTGRPHVHLSHSENESIEVTDELGGELGGRMDVWNTVRGLADDLDTFASELATAFNTQHAAGFDLNSNAGGDLFSFDPGAPAETLTVDAAVIGDAALLAFGGSAPTLAGDIDNLRAFLAMEEDATLIDGRRSASAWITDLTTELGTAVSRVEQVAQSQDVLVRDLEELHQNLHGIDLDEEATNLMLYQTAYQAAARVIAANDGLMDNLLELV